MLDITHLKNGSEMTCYGFLEKGSYANSVDTWIGNVNFGFGEIGSLSQYPTSTWNAGGFNLMTGQPTDYQAQPDE